MDTQEIIKKMFGDAKGPFRPSEVAKVIRCDPRTIEKACKNGSIFAFRVGREYRIPLEAIPQLTNQPQRGI